MEAIRAGSPALQWAKVSPPIWAACYPQWERGFHADARQSGIAVCAGQNGLVAVARSRNLSARALARAPHPHST